MLYTFVQVTVDSEDESHPTLETDESYTLKVGKEGGGGDAHTAPIHTGMCIHPHVC